MLYIKPRIGLHEILEEDIITLSNAGDELPGDSTGWGDLEGETGEDEEWWL